jgi:hypothetical protein
MSCRSEQHTLPNGDIRMDLHCFNVDCHFRNTFHIYNAHMGVIVKPNQPWICDRYHLPFLFDNREYVLEGEYSSKNHRGFPDMTSKRRTTLYWQKYGKGYMDDLLATVPWAQRVEIMHLDFIPISTGNDMHEKAWELFHRLKNIAIFA